MMKAFSARTIFASIASLLVVGSAIARADSASPQGEPPSNSPLSNDSDIEKAWVEYEAKCKAIDEEASQKIAALPKVEWTGEDAELFWDQIAETANQTSTAPRWSDTDAKTGEGLLEAFGTRYMPNAYATYQEARAVAKEREQLLTENFPRGRSSDSTGGTLYDKVSKGCAKAVAEMFRRHDELCHFYLLHRTGAVKEADLAGLDGGRLTVVLPEIGEPPAEYSRTIEDIQERDFAQKYLPETWAGYQRLKTALADGMKNYAEWRRDAMSIDAVRSETLLRPVRYTLDGIGRRMEGTVQFVKEKKLLHAVGEATAAQLAEEDRRRADAIRDFENTASLPAKVKSVAEATEQRLKEGWLAENHRDYVGRVAAIRSVAVRDKASARQAAIEQCPALRKDKRIILSVILEDMIPIPGKGYCMGKTEVTQAQWEAVMGNNPSGNKGADNPVETVSWDDCQEFLRKLNALPAVKDSGLVFRLPTDAEWEYACRAGGTGDCCKLADGTEITGDTLGRVAWYKDNSDKKAHSVGQKEPNAFGLYDMFGNVWEWCQEEIGEVWDYAQGKDYEHDRVLRGDCYYSPALISGSLFIGASKRFRAPSDNRGSANGFRLCATSTQDTQDTQGTQDTQDTQVEPIPGLSMVKIPEKDYWIGKTEVTQAQWEAVMGNNPSENKGADNPVECVSWDDCQQFIEEINSLPAVKDSGLVFRLPRSAEWEYACCAGATDHYCKLANGTEITEDTLGRVAWHDDNSGDETHPVGQKAPNAFGLYDMLGNVREWCQEENGRMNDHVKAKGRVNEHWRFCQGGGFYEPPVACRADFGGSSPSDSRYRSIGFRLCAEKR